MRVVHVAITVHLIALTSASLFPHSDHHAPLRKRSGGLPSSTRLRRHAGPAAFPPEMHVTEAQAPTADHTAGLAVQGYQASVDDTYFAEVEIGTPPATYELQVDSGSSDLWVSSDACPNCNQKALGRTTSSTFARVPGFWSISYGGSDATKVNGTLCTDTVRVAGFTLQNHTFGVIDVSDDEFLAAGAAPDGMLGTGRKPGSAQGTMTVAEAIYGRGLGTGVTGYRLGRSNDGVNVGQVTFGGVDTSAFVEPSVTLANAIPLGDTLDGHWAVALDGVSANGPDLGLAGRNIVLDTGAPRLYVPPADAAALHAAIPGALGPNSNGDYFIPCETNVSLALSVGGQAFAVDPRDLLNGRADEADPAAGCLSGVAASVGTAYLNPYWLVGDVFLKNVYFATSIADNTVMLARLAEPVRSGGDSRAGQGARPRRRRVRW